jgi:ankyrin repeat protein
MAELLDSGAPINWADREGKTPLIAACEYQVEGATHHLQAVRLLIERGVALDHADCEGNVAAFHAAYYGNESCLKELIAAGASLTKENFQGQSITWAATLRNGQTAGHKACRDLLTGTSIPPN